MDQRWRSAPASRRGGRRICAMLTEIEMALDSRWAADRPRCPDCGVMLEVWGQEVWQLTATHTQPVILALS